MNQKEYKLYDGRTITFFFDDGKVGYITLHAMDALVGEIQKLAAERDDAIDAVPVVHGRWVDNMCRDWRCSECGEKIHKVRNVDGYCYDDKPNYCPNCGCRMDLEND